jgi:hypothetical protein
LNITTGFNFSIDYITAYETLPIESEDKTSGWYANLPHTDKPFTKNTLKVILPIKNAINEEVKRWYGYAMKRISSDYNRNGNNEKDEEDDKDDKIKVSKDKRCHLIWEGV